MSEMVSHAIPLWQYALRAGWVAVQFALVFLIGRKGVIFFYQAF